MKRESIIFYLINANINYFMDYLSMKNSSEMIS